MQTTKTLKIFPLLLSLCLLVPLTGCDKNQNQPEQPSPVQPTSEVKDVSEVARGQTSEIADIPTENSTEQLDLSNKIKASRIYALDMFKQFNAFNNANTPEQNLIISPLSIEYIMAMLMTGADQKNTDMILKSLHLSKVNKDGLNKALSENMQAYKQKANNDAQLLLANGIFVRKNYIINPDYQKQMKELFQANIQSIGDNDAKIINSWIAQETQGRIKRVVDNPISDTTLINTTYFKGKWPDKFFQKERTTNRLFEGTNTQKPIPTMFQGGLTRYYEDQNVQALYQPYKGEDYAILLLLPKEKTAKGLDLFINKLDEPYFTKIIDSSRSPDKNYEGTLYLPKFEVTYKNDQLLENSQKLLGIDLQKRLFPHIVNADLEITLMLQLANITLNEEGTEAAAATVVEMEATAALIEPKPEPIRFVMDINHPFAYAIVDKEGNIAFIGTIKNIQ